MIEAENATIVAPSPNSERSETAVPKRPLASSDEVAEIVIQPTHGSVAVNWRELYAYRELLVFFVWRDISARYKQTVLGSAWAILQPLILMGIFTFISRFAKIPTPGDLPYPVFVYAGLIPWTFFSQAMPQSALSLVSHAHMLTKVYFPRLLLPLSAAMVFLVDVAYSLVIYAVILLVYGVVPSWTIIFLPVMILLTLIGTLSMGVMLSALTLFYRDFRHVIPFVVQIMMYCTPVFYPASMIPDKYHWFLALNPMFGIVDAYRAVILGTELDVRCLLISSTSALILLVFAIKYFSRAERRFADFA